MVISVLLPPPYSPARDKVRQEHEEIVAMLNQRMAEKARFVPLGTINCCKIIANFLSSSTVELSHLNLKSIKL